MKIWGTLLRVTSLLLLFDAHLLITGVVVIANNGWANFTVPTCIAPGQYLLRVELLALHSAYSQGGAQFYMSCAQIKVSGSGTFQPSQTVSLPGAYKATDPGILINIYGSSGSPDMGGKAYVAPGPAPITC